MADEQKETKANEQQGQTCSTTKQGNKSCGCGS